MNTYTSILVNWTELGFDKHLPITTAMIFVNEECEDPDDFLDYVVNTILRNIEKEHQGLLEFFSHDEFKYHRKHFGVKGDRDFPQNSKIWAENVSDFEDQLERASYYMAASEKSWSVEVISEGGIILSITQRKMRPIVSNIICNVPETGENFTLSYNYSHTYKTMEETFRYSIDNAYKMIMDIRKRQQGSPDADQVWEAELEVRGEGTYRVKELKRISQKPITTIWSYYDEIGY